MASSWLHPWFRRTARRSSSQGPARPHRTRLDLEPLEKRVLPSFVTGTPFTTGKKPLSMVAADLNRDGHTDLVIANQGDSDVSVLLGNGNGTFKRAVTYAAGGA